MFLFRSLGSRQSLTFFLPSGVSLTLHTMKFTQSVGSHRLQSSCQVPPCIGEVCVLERCVGGERLGRGCQPAGCDTSLLGSGLACRSNLHILSGRLTLKAAHAAHPFLFQGCPYIERFVLISSTFAVIIPSSWHS